MIISGDITCAGKSFQGPTRLHMEQPILPIYRNKVSITIDSFDYTHALLLGAVACFECMRPA